MTHIACVHGVMGAGWGCTLCNPELNRNAAALCPHGAPIGFCVPCKDSERQAWQETSERIHERAKIVIGADKKPEPEPACDKPEPTPEVDAEDARLKLQGLLWPVGGNRSWPEIVSAVRGLQAAYRATSEQLSRNAASLGDLIAEKVIRESAKPTAWQCPACNVVWAPSVRSCQCAAGAKT